MNYAESNSTLENLAMHFNARRFLLTFTNHRWVKDEFGRADFGAGSYDWVAAMPRARCEACGYEAGLWESVLVYCKAVTR